MTLTHTVKFRETGLTLQYLTDLATAFYGKVQMLAGVDDEVEVVFEDVQDEDIGALKARWCLEGFKHAISNFPPNNL